MENTKIEIASELKERIIPFWNKLIDEENGGFYGEVDFALNVDKEALKGTTLNSRILWFYSKTYKQLGDKELLQKAHHAYEFLMNKCIDNEYGGLYWTVDYKGSPLDTTKSTYNISYAIYALSAYYEVTDNEAALSCAIELFELIETKCRDEVGYLDSFTREFLAGGNDMLSENGVVAERTMNTLLHVFEGYSALYEVSGDAKVEKCMRKIVALFKEKIYNDELRRQEVFFDKNYNSIIDLQSYGHDIEAAWLFDWGCGLLKDEELSREISAITSKLVACVYDEAFTEKGLIGECDKGVKSGNRAWWPQTEAVIGFANEWQKDPTKTKYSDAVVAMWSFIKEYMLYRQENGEWYAELDSNYVPMEEKNTVDIWKCPYHNGRMCLEIIKRI